MDKSINERVAEETLKKIDSSSREERRRLDKILKKMSPNDKMHLIMAVQQDTVASIIKNTNKELVLDVYRSAFEYLYDTFLRPLAVENEMTSEEKQELINNMINHIGTEAAKYKLKKEKVKQLIKDREGDKQSE